MKISTDEQLARRYYRLTAGVTFVLLIIIGLSIFEFGAEAFEKRWQIGLIMEGRHDGAGWSRDQYQHLATACQRGGYDLTVRDEVAGNTEKNRSVVAEMAGRGINLIFLLNDTSQTELNNFTKKYPRVKFFLIDKTTAITNNGKYYLRYFEPCYLAGMVAGMRTKTQKVGYLAPYSTTIINQGINAFVRGVQRTNPSAEVLLFWTSDWESSKNAQMGVQIMKAEHVDVISYQQEGDAVPLAAEGAGIEFFSFGESYDNFYHSLGTISMNWTEVYTDIIARHRRQTFANIHWVGISDNKVDLLLVPNKISPRERAVVETIRWEIKEHKPVFYGDIYDRGGNLRVTAQELLSGRSLEEDMDWLVKGVRTVGS